MQNVSTWDEIIMAGFVNNMGGGEAMGSPCMQNVPAGTTTVLVSSVNEVTTTTATSNVTNILYGGVFVINQMTENLISSGSIPDGGMVTGGLYDEMQNIGSSIVLCLSGMMAVCYGDITGHNKDFNCYGTYYVPAPPSKWMTGK